MLLDCDAQHFAKTLPDRCRAFGKVRGGPELRNRESQLVVQLKGQLPALQHDPHRQAELRRLDAGTNARQPAVFRRQGQNRRGLRKEEDSERPMVGTLASS